MREIKFRAWDTILKTYDHACDIAIKPNGEIIFDDDMDTYKSSDFILEQFTGLHDANGKKIYEGDIIKHDVWGMLGAVEYEGGMYRCAKDDKDIFLNSCQLKTKCKIIGNIHEAQQ